MCGLMGFVLGGDRMATVLAVILTLLLAGMFAAIMTVTTMEDV